MNTFSAVSTEGLIVFFGPANYESKEINGIYFKIRNLVAGLAFDFCEGVAIQNAKVRMASDRGTALITNRLPSMPTRALAFPYSNGCCGKAFWSLYAFPIKFLDDRVTNELRPITVIELLHRGI